MGFYPPTAEGFIEAFGQLHGHFWCKAEKFYQQKGAGPVPEGTVLLAAAATDTAPACIHKVDFQTGAPTISLNHAEADGTNAQQFQANALHHLASLRLGNGDTGVPLDMWAARCVDDAIKSCPDHISSPVDALIARPSTVGDRILVHRRMTKLPPLPFDLFRVP
jgi:hypothetical protein